jgi:hypothetical protein
VEERVSVIKDKVEELLYSDGNKGEKSNHNHSTQNLLDMTKNSNIQICGAEERAVVQTEDTENFSMKL